MRMLAREGDAPDVPINIVRPMCRRLMRERRAGGPLHRPSRVRVLKSQETPLPAKEGSHSALGESNR